MAPGVQHLRVAWPSSTRPRRMSSNRARLSPVGRSRQGLGSLFFLQPICSLSYVGRYGSIKQAGCQPQSVSHPEQYSMI